MANSGTGNIRGLLNFLVPMVVFRYANNSNYKNDTMIRKEAYSHQVMLSSSPLIHFVQAVMDELRRIIEDSEV